MVEAINSWNTRDRAVSSEDRAVSSEEDQRVQNNMTMHQQQELTLKCQTLHKAHDKSLIHVPNLEICQSTASQMKIEEAPKNGHKFAMNLNTEFCRQEAFNNPASP